MKSRFVLSMISLAAALLGGCSGASSGEISGNGDPGAGSPGAGSSGGEGGGAQEQLFAAPENGDATPDSIYGIWGGSLKDGAFTFDSRLKLAATSATFAMKCVRDDRSEFATVGFTVAARVDNSEIAVLESKKDEKKVGDITCRTHTTPTTLKRCESDDTFPKQCFTLDRTELTMYGDSPLAKSVMTKLSD